jgi:hypothetical protein
MENSKVLMYLLKSTSWCRIGNFVASKTIKRDLQSAYNAVGLQRKAKATEIVDYLNATEIVKKIDGKPTRGYLIVDF